MIHLFAMPLAAVLHMSSYSATTTPLDCYTYYASSYNDDNVQYTEQNVTDDYYGFSKCAAEALDWIQHKPDKECHFKDQYGSDCWSVYFASAVGATYSQVLLAGHTHGQERCNHYNVAFDTILQAKNTELDTAYHFPVQTTGGDWEDGVAAQITEQEKADGCKV